MRVSSATDADEVNVSLDVASIHHCFFFSLPRLNFKEWMVTKS